MGFDLEQWRKEFHPRLGESPRWGGFCHIAKELSQRDHIWILETGCVRVTDDWHGNGQSTLQWQWMRERSAGHVISVDHNRQNVALARRLCPDVVVACEDSLHYLAMTCQSSPHIPYLSLLYLDSMDHDPPYAESELHAIGELAIIWPKLPSGCLIAVDDCNGDGTGKHNFIKYFFQRLGVQPEKAGYIHVWRKP